MSDYSDDDINTIDSFTNKSSLPNIPRTKNQRMPSTQIFDENTSEAEVPPKTYPISEYLPKFYDKFQNRYQLQYTNSKVEDKQDNDHFYYNNAKFIKDHNYCYLTPKLQDEIIIPIPTTDFLETAIVFYLDISYLNVGGQKHPAIFNHSWRDIYQYTSVEAQQIIDQFLEQSYQSIANVKSNKTLTKTLKQFPRISKTHKRTTSPPTSQNSLGNIQLNDGRAMSVSSLHNHQQSVYVKCQTITPKSTNKKNLWKSGKTGRMHIFHYIGLGLPPPEKNALWIGEPTPGKENLVEIQKLNVYPPSLVILDCDNAAILQDYFNLPEFNIYKSNNSENPKKVTFCAFFACSKDEILRIPSTLPQNLFSCILLTPDKAFSEITKIEVKDENVFHQLLSIFTETIALDCFPSETFCLLFRNNPAISTLWKRFFLAQRLMHTFGLHSRSCPELRDASENQLWYQFEYALMSSSLSHDSPNNFTKAVNNLETKHNSSILLTSDPILNLSHMYFMSYDNLEDPPSYVSAFIASLMQLSSINLNVLERIARFMSKSPRNCYIMARVINHEDLLNLYDTVQNHSASAFADWCCVLSGILLASPTLATSIISNSMGSLQTSALTNKVSSILSKQYGNRNEKQITLSNSESSDASLMSSHSLANIRNSSDFENFSDTISVYLLSIIVSAKDAQNKKNNYLQTDKHFDSFINMIYDVNPILREWIAIYIHSTCAFYSPNNDVNGPLGLHALCSLLLFEKRKFTRVAGLATLITMFNEISYKKDSFNSFNEVLMNCALKAALDGSSIVRHVFLYCVAHYLLNSSPKKEEKVQNTEMSDTYSFSSINEDNSYDFIYTVQLDEQCKIDNKIVDDMIKCDIHTFSSSEVNLQQKLNRLLEFYLNDPYEENRNLAIKIINNELPADLIDQHLAYERKVHQMAHTLLFMHEDDSSKIIKQRYGNDFFEDDEIEMFDLVDTQSGPISAISFDFEHKTFCTASENGEVVWGNNRWKIGNGQIIESICPLRDRAWAALSRDGIVYILRDGNDQEIDAFRPSIRIAQKESQESVCKYNREKYKRFQDYKKQIKLRGKDLSRELVQQPVSHIDERKFEKNCSALCSSPDSPIIFVSNGSREILAWDIEALLLIGRIDVESPPKFLIRIADKLYAALNNGVVLQINVSSFSNNKAADEVHFVVEKRNEMFKNNKIVRIGKHNDILFSAAERGPLYFWEDFEFPRQITDDFDMECFDYLVHPIYPVALKIQDTPTLLELYQDAPIELVTNRKHCSTCCCFDADNPLCAIGYDDGYVSVWRIKKPTNNPE